MAERHPGTHGGSLDGEARHRRVAKNQRNRSRRGQATRVPGATKRVTSRIFLKGPQRGR